MRGKVYELIDELDPASFDVVADFSALFPNEVITTMLGVPKEDRHQIRLWLDLLLKRKPGRDRHHARGLRRFGADRHLLLQPYSAAARAAAGRHDQPAHRDRNRTRRSAEKLTDVDIAGFATLLGGAGAETVTKLVGNAIVAFEDFPDEWQKLRDDRSKVPAGVEELLRYEAPSQYQVRTATRDVTLHGKTIPAGSAVLLMTGSATRDERCSPNRTG